MAAAPYGELQVEAERIRLAIEAAGIGTWDYDPVSEKLNWDARCKALFGLPPEAPVDYENVFLAGLHPEDRDRTHTAVQASLSTIETSRYDIEYRTVGLADGIERWIAATGDTIFENGRAVRFIGTVRDITARKVAERRFAILNRTSTAVATDLDIERIVQSITDAGVEMTGAQFGAFFYNVQDERGEWYTLYALAGVPNEAFSSFPMPRNTRVFAPTFSGEGVVRSDNIRLDPRYGHNTPYKGMPDGHLPVCSYLAVPVKSRSGDVIGGLFFGHEDPGIFLVEHEDVLLGMAAQAATAIENARLLQSMQRELNERRRAEETVHRNETRLAFLDKLGRATAAAEDADAILAITTRMLGEHLGVDICAYADMEPDQDAFTIRGDWSRLGIASIVGRYSLQDFGDLAVAKLRSGAPLVLNDNIAEIGEEQSAMFLQIGIRATVCMPFLKQGALKALMAIHQAVPHTWTQEELALLTEVTERSWSHIERVRSSAALMSLNANLEERVAQEVSARLRAEAQLHQAQKMEAIGQLTGGIAHDFNNMLSVVVGGLQLARRRLAQGRTDVDGLVESAMEGAQRAAALTHRLLAFSRRQGLQPEVVEPNKLIAAMTELLTRTLGETVHVETVLAPDAWVINTDPVQLESAILNLCVNSRDAMPKGGTLTIRTENAVVNETSTPSGGVKSGDYVVIIVSDTGLGMPQDVLAKAFDPFFTTKPVGKGSGLGLSQVFGFVQQSGGEVKIESAEGVGTTISLFMPRHLGPAIQAADKVPPAVAPPPAMDATVLVVEDDDRVRNFSTQALAELGYTVLAAASGREALSILAGSAKVDLLFTDMVMPEMTGAELADAAAALRPDLRVLFTTGYARGALASRTVGGSLGPVILPKPFTLDQLADKIGRVLNPAITT